MLIQQAPEAYSNPSLSAKLRRHKLPIDLSPLWARVTTERDNARRVSNTGRVIARVPVAGCLDYSDDLTPEERHRRGDARSAE